AIIERVVSDAFTVLKKLTKKYEVLVVNDCSTDKTELILKKLSLKYKNLKIVNLKKNMGIGNANNYIYHHVKGDILFWNASDNQIRMDELFSLIPYSKKYDIVVGKRINRADNAFRKIASYLFSLFLKIRFRIRVKDVDSVKVFNVKSLKKINPESKTAFIETEILIKAMRRNMNIIELPIKHHPRTAGKASGIRLKIIIPQMWQTFKESLKFWQ
ncbi:MAG: glycosyltransferase family 2 protein, partial [Candidatus Woesearchaeota archaeon]